MISGYKYVSVLSQLYHLGNFLLQKPKMRLEKAMFIVSVDIDVGSKEIAVINEGENDENVHNHMSEYLVGEIEERTLPLFIDFFNNLEIPVTFAVRGQLAEVNTPILDFLRESPVKHDIGSHGYYHRSFTYLSKSQAEIELNMISASMKKLGVIPKSFVFPRNHVAYLSLLEKYGYKCYRAYGDFRNDGMYIEKHGEMYDIHPSFYLGQSITPIFLNKILDISTKNKLPFHVWLHAWNFGETKESASKGIARVLSPVFEYAKEKQKKALLTFETMLSSANKIEAMLGSP